MLGIIDAFAPLFREMPEALADVFEILIQADAERRADMEIIGFADEADRFRAGIHDFSQHLVIGGRAARALGHAKSQKARMGELWRRGEKLGIGRVRARPAALDIVDAKIIERGGDLQLVGSREIDALRLLPVTKRGVEQIEAFALTGAARALGPR